MGALKSWLDTGSSNLFVMVLEHGYDISKLEDQHIFCSCTLGRGFMKAAAAILRRKIGENRR